MKIAYFDCFSGISGDMILGSLIDAGLPAEVLEAQLKKLNLPEFSLEFKKVVKCGITGTKVNVHTKEVNVHRHLKDIFAILEQSSLEKSVIAKVKEIFNNLAIAEAKVHNTTPDKIHFHEVGAVDAIVDIVGAVVGLKELGVEEVYASPLNLGSGFVKCEHGLMPVPAPATVELLKGVPSYTSDIKQELVTPTGAAVVSTLAKGFGNMPELVISCLGYGAGERDLEIPNLLRLIIGEKTASKSSTTDSFIIETNIDDMNPEFFEYLLDRLENEGALDISLIPIYMKKNRPGILLRVLVNEKNKEKIINLIFEETTTLGVRTYPAKQLSLAVEYVSVDSDYGKIRVKVSKQGNRILNFSPNLEDCKQAAIKHKLPLKEIYKQVSSVFTQQIKLNQL